MSSSAVSNTVRIAEACTLDFALNKTHLPQYKVPEGFTRESYLEHLAMDGLADRLKRTAERHTGHVVRSALAGRIAR